MAKIQWFKDPSSVITPKKIENSWKQIHKTHQKLSENFHFNGKLNYCESVTKETQIMSYNSKLPH